MLIGIIRQASSFILLFVIMYIMFVHTFSLVYYDPDCYEDHDDEEERSRCSPWTEETLSQDAMLTVGFMTLGETALA